VRHDARGLRRRAENAERDVRAGSSIARVRPRPNRRSEARARRLARLVRRIPADEVKRANRARRASSLVAASTTGMPWR
jgi:hypothetical protein